MLWGFFLSGKKARRDEAKNRKRLDEAALVSRRLAFLRVSDGDIKKCVARLCYEADAYIASSREDPQAIYDPLALDALDTAAAAVNTFLRADNEAAVEKHFPAGIDANSAANSAAEREEAEKSEVREKVLEVLQDGITILQERNTAEPAGDLDAAITDMGIIK
jgi:hypothetical protein